MKRKLSPILILFLCCCLAVQSAAAALSAVNNASMEMLHTAATVSPSEGSMHEHHATDSNTNDEQQAIHTTDQQHADVVHHETTAMDCCDCDCEANCVMGCHPATILASIQLSIPHRKHLHSSLTKTPPSISPQQTLRPPIQH